LRGRTQQARPDLPHNLPLSKGNLGTARNATGLYAIDVAEFPEWCSRLGFFRCSGLNALGGLVDMFVWYVRFLTVPGEGVRAGFPRGDKWPNADG
jgi:hypothetical protein